ncbi:MAG: Uncharacterized protein FD161_399 [Limisphaerales bacterium]|nr:MAG: Uncharacterized protein FD161_399 [Limisphaerales bacterium]KAG0510304.1 MAG: Uncharacterized protein E1N63_399 [Limisphaerales bacterium]TXT51491.1 MAG: Uncharacterized protein FD140_1529 [Limisphaerales bacterium]
MQPNWAEENLQVIRTLMERAGLYRRALAPVMTSVGALGVAAGVWGWFAKLNNLLAFVSTWLSVAIAALVLSLMVIRRQAVMANEVFWTPATRRVVWSMLLPFATALFFAVPQWGHYLIGDWILGENEERGLHAARFTVPLLLGFYGCGLNSGGQFISRGVRTLGWVFASCGAILLFHLQFGGRTFFALGKSHWLNSPHVWMGLTFGALHLLAGVYLYFTEKREPAT